MKPLEFEHQNTVFAKDQPQYQSLPALRLEDSPGGEVITCWGLSFKERLKILFTGKMWVSLMMFGKDVTPSYLSVNREEVYYHPSDDAPKWYDEPLNFNCFSGGISSLK